MGVLEANTTLIYGIHVRESANDGSDFTNAAADYRVLFLGEDGLLHLKDSSGTVTDIGAASTEPAWTSFTPTWTGASGNPAIGNGTINAAYITTGKTHKFRIHITMGSTTTFGSGRWDLTIGGGVTTIAAIQVVSCYMLDNSATAARGVVAWVPASSSICRPVGHDGAINGVSSTVPWTWAQNDSLVVEGVVEIA